MRKSKFIFFFCISYFLMHRMEIIFAQVVLFDKHKHSCTYD